MRALCERGIVLVPAPAPRRELVTAAGIIGAVLTAVSSCHRPKGYGRSGSVVKCCRGIPQGLQREHPGKEGPGIAGRVLDWMQHCTAHVTCPRRLAAHVISTPGCLAVRSDDLRGVARVCWREFVKKRDLTRFRLPDQNPHPRPHAVADLPKVAAASCRRANAWSSFRPWTEIHCLC